MRPDYVTQKHIDYLDLLRESGETNMYGAGPFLVANFPIDLKLAHKILTYWMESFGEEDR
jgi:uncharacterized protein YciI